MLDRTLESADKVFNAIRAALKKNPDMRVGQILCNTMNYGALYYSENDLIVKTLIDFYKLTEEDLVEQPKPAPVIETKVKRSIDTVPTIKTSNKGRVYINKNGVSKSIPPEDLAQYTDAGWKMGRANSKHNI